MKALFFSFFLVFAQKSFDVDKLLFMCYDKNMDIKRILSYTRRAVDDYGMIEQGDRIAVGVSGGKDSLALMCAMAHLRGFYPKKFEVCAITVDMGFEKADFSKIEALAKELQIEYTVIKTKISNIIFDVRQEKNPCSLCAKMRRGALNRAALELGCNKIALGHHLDDVVETFFLNLLYSGRIGTFSPVTKLDRTGLVSIRPFVYLPEKNVRYFASKEGLPVIESCCPKDGNSEREEMKNLILSLSKKNKDLKNKVFGAIKRSNLDGF